MTQREVACMHVRTRSQWFDPDQNSNISRPSTVCCLVLTSDCSIRELADWKLSTVPLKLSSDYNTRYASIVCLDIDSEDELSSLRRTHSVECYGTSAAEPLAQHPQRGFVRPSSRGCRNNVEILSADVQADKHINMTTDIPGQHRDIPVGCGATAPALPAHAASVVVGLQDTKPCEGKRTAAKPELHRWCSKSRASSLVSREAGPRCRNSSEARPASAWSSAQGVSGSHKARRPVAARVSTGPTAPTHQAQAQFSPSETGPVRRTGAMAGK